MKTHNISKYMIGKVITTIASTPLFKKVTKYLSPKLVLKVTRQHKFDGRAKSETLIVTLGAPNYQERRFIRRCKEAGEPFPVRNLQLKWAK